MFKPVTTQNLYNSKRSMLSTATPERTRNNNNNNNRIIKRCPDAPIKLLPPDDEPQWINLEPRNLMDSFLNDVPDTNMLVEAPRTKSRRH